MRISAKHTSHTADDITKVLGENPGVSSTSTSCPASNQDTKREKKPKRVANVFESNCD